jgi:hypothetical protein
LAASVSLIQALTRLGSLCEPHTGSHAPSNTTQLNGKTCAFHHKLTTLEDIWKNKQLLNPGQWKRGSFTKKQFDDFVVSVSSPIHSFVFFENDVICVKTETDINPLQVSEVFAEETTGTAHLLIAETVEPRARKSSLYPHVYLITSPAPTDPSCH